MEDLAGALLLKAGWEAGGRAGGRAGGSEGGAEPCCASRPRAWRGAPPGRRHSRCGQRTGMCMRSCWYGMPFARRLCSYSAPGKAKTAPSRRAAVPCRASGVQPRGRSEHHYRHRLAPARGGGAAGGGGAGAAGRDARALPADLARGRQRERARGRAGRGGAGRGGAGRGGAGRGGAGRGGAGRGGAGRGGQRCLCVGTPLLLSCGFPGCFAGAASRAALCVRQLAHERCGYSCRGGPAVASAIGAGCVPDPAHWQRHAGPPAVPLAPTCLSTGHPPSRPPICVHSPPAPRRRPSPSPTPSSWRWGRARRWASCGGACRRGWSCQRRSLRSGAPSPARECQDGAKTARVPCS